MQRFTHSVFDEITLTPASCDFDWPSNVVIEFHVFLANLIYEARGKTYFEVWELHRCDHEQERWKDNGTGTPDLSFLCCST